MTERRAQTSPVVGRAATHGSHPTLGRAPTHDQLPSVPRPATSTGSRPIVGRAPTTETPLVGRAPTHGQIPSITRPATVVGRAPTTETPIAGRTPTRPPSITDASPIVGRAPTQQTALGLPALGRTPTQPAIARTSSRPSIEIPSVLREGPRASTQSGAQPVAGRASTQSGAHAIPSITRSPSRPSIQVPPVGEPPVIGRAPTAPPVVGRAPTAPPVVGRTPSEEIGLARSALAADAPVRPRAPTHRQVSATIPPFAVPAAPPAAPLEMASFAAPSSPVPAAMPANVTVSFSGLPPAIAAAIAAPPESARTMAPHLVLPPYVPAPNVGDPGEAIATLPVDKIEMTELVEPLPLPVLEAPVAPRDEVSARASILPMLWRFAPLAGAVALVLVFVIGFLVFDGEGRPKMPVVKAPPPSAATASAAAVVVETPTTPAPAPDPAPSEPVTPAPAPAPTPVAATTEAKPVAKPVRGKLYIRANRPVQIFLDGRSANAVTPRQLTVRPGTHKVTLWDTVSGKTFTQLIDVPADKTVTVSKKF